MASRFAGFEVRVTEHFKSQMIAKGFDPEEIIAVIHRPDREYPSGSRYPGQWRLCGRGVCIVTKPEGRTLTLITCYVDGTLTEVRPDQLNTPQGRRFAQRQARGLGRG